MARRRDVAGLSSLATISARSFYLTSSRPPRISPRPETNQLALRQPYCAAAKRRERNKNETGTVALESRRDRERWRRYRGSARKKRTRKRKKVLRRALVIIFEDPKNQLLSKRPAFISLRRYRIFTETLESVKDNSMTLALLVQRFERDAQDES